MDAFPQSNQVSVPNMVKASKIYFCRPNLLSHLYFWKSPIGKLDEKLYGISAQKSLRIS